MSDGDAAVSFPHATVIMPVRNEGGFITRSLGAVLAQDYPKELLEVIVADGMSDDGTREAIVDLKRTHANLRLIDNPGRIVAKGLNAAIPLATGDIIVRVDGHTIIASDYVSECVRALERTGADNVGGRMTAEGATPFARAVALATSSPFGVGGARFHYSTEEEWVDTVYLGAWRKEVFARIGGFDEELVRNQDDELNYRLRRHGGRILLTPKIRSTYFNRTSLKSLWRQYFQYGYWKVRVVQKQTLQIRPRQLVPAAFVCGIAALAALGFLWTPAWGALVGTLLLYGSAAVVATASLRSRDPGASLAWIPLVFAVLHVAYGLGFIAGLVRFWNRWSRNGVSSAAPAPR